MLAYRQKFPVGELSDLLDIAEAKRRAVVLLDGRFDRLGTQAPDCLLGPKVDPGRALQESSELLLIAFRPLEYHVLESNISCNFNDFLGC